MIKHFNIIPVQHSTEAEIQRKIDLKTKPTGALGMLEKIALQIALVQKTSSPQLNNPHILVFAADHGIANEGVSAYPQEVTWQMVFNFIQGGAAINVFARQSGIEIKVIDAGVKHEFPPDSGVIDAKIALGTESFLQKPAMSAEQLEQCIERGAALVNRIADAGCNVVGFGEMGIGNTSTAAVLMSLLCTLPLDACVGRGTGLNDEQFIRKLEVLGKAIKNGYKDDMEPAEIMAHFGGFEIVMMCGAMLQAAELGMIVLVDGFISSVAFLCASKLNSAVREYAIFCHLSDESGHRRLLQYFDAAPVLQLNMRLGEGTGCAVAYPVIKNAVAFLNEMASFESAGVSNK